MERAGWTIRLSDDATVDSLSFARSPTFWPGELEGPASTTMASRLPRSRPDSWQKEGKEIATATQLIFVWIYHTYHPIVDHNKIADAPRQP